MSAAGVTLPLLSQSIILFQIALSYLVLKKNLEREQVSDVPFTNRLSTFHLSHPGQLFAVVLM